MGSSGCRAGTRSLPGGAQVQGVGGGWCRVPGREGSVLAAAKSVGVSFAVVFVVMPPQIPYGSPVVRACSRHWMSTGQSWQICLGPRFAADLGRYRVHCRGRRTPTVRYRGTRRCPAILRVRSGPRVSAWMGFVRGAVWFLLFPNGRICGQIRTQETEFSVLSMCRGVSVAARSGQQTGHLGLTGSADGLVSALGGRVSNPRRWR